MTGRVTCSHQLFTVRHVLSNKGAVETGRGECDLTQFTDLVLRQYFTNDLLNLNDHYHKRHWSKMRKLDLLEPQFFLFFRGSVVGWRKRGERSINLMQVSEVKF